MKKKKHLGQNFLINQKIISDIANLINPDENDLIIEIGAGSGNLTKDLKKYKATIYSYEIDLDLKNILEKVADDKTHFIFKDFLKTDIEKDINLSKYNRIFLVGNLPYYITTPIITKIIDDNIRYDKIVFLVQKEVAERFSANVNTKEYSYFTVLLNYIFNIEYHFKVTAKNFTPAPKVDSAVVSLSYHGKYNYDQRFINFIKKCFVHKRKKLSNNFDEKNKIEQILKKMKIDSNARPENIAVDQYLELYSKYISKS